MIRRLCLRATRIVLLVALLLAALPPHAAFAEDGPPADPLPADSGGVAAPAPPVPEPAADDEATEEAGAPDAATATPAHDVAADSALPAVDPPDEAAAPDPAPDDDALAEGSPQAETGLVVDLPLDTTLAVLDAAGEPVSLVSDEAEAIAAVADPIWCPASVSVPVDNGSGCSPAFPSLRELTDYLSLHEPAADGVIWIQSGTDPGIDAIYLDGSVSFYPIWTNYRLTLRGGWDGLGTGTITEHDPYTDGTGSIFHVPFEIVNWQNDVTLTDIVIEDLWQSIPALTITTTGKTTLTRVTTRRNGGPGVSIDNTAGTADVQLTQVHLRDNAGGAGLGVQSRGAITLNNFLSIHNGGDGVALDNSTAPIPRNVAAAGAWWRGVEDNAGAGLRVTSLGTINVAYLTAERNGLQGAVLTNTLGSAGVTLAGINTFAQNGASGLEVQTRGAITAAALVADLNGGWGAMLDNSGAASPKAVTLNGTNEFKLNDAGLFVSSAGAITISKLTATWNDSGSGVSLRNNGLGSVGDVKLLGAVNASDNFGDGLEVYSNGAISLGNLTASRNGAGGGDGFGAYFENQTAPSAKSITLTGANLLSGNFSGGIYALSRGSIALSQMTVVGSNGTGAYLDNSSTGPAAPLPVTLTSYGVFDHHVGVGLYINTYGVITLANVTARLNGDDGARLDNSQSGTATRANKVTLTGTNIFEQDAYGLFVTSLGSISVSNLRASWNSIYGASLDNHEAGSGTITLGGTSLFSWNNGIGLYAMSRGAIVVADVSADHNTHHGLVLNNAWDGAAGNVTLGTSRAGWCNRLEANATSGLEVYSNGTVSLSNVCSSGNGYNSTSGWGTLVNNATASSPRAVTLKGMNSFNTNYSGGLSLLSRGAVTVSSLTATGNAYGPGASIANTAGTAAAPQNVTLSGTNALSSNGGRGLDILTFGAVTLSSLTAGGNGNGGVLVDNATGAAAVRGITINGYVRTHGNTGSGLTLASLGAIKIASPSADSNTDYGALLNNAFAGSLGGITLLGAEVSFSSNSGYGLDVASLGAISITTTAGLTATGNGSLGARLDNTGSGAASPQTVTIKGPGTFSSNGGDGLRITTFGAISLANLSASGNGLAGSGYGAYLDNYNEYDFGDTFSPRAVLISGVNTFNGNTATGLYAVSLGAMSVSNVAASGNGATGAYLDNQWGQPVPAAWTLSGTNTFDDNGASGLLGYSHGSIRANSISASSNGGSGAILSTWGWAGSLTLTGRNMFRDNGDFDAHTGDGLFAETDGVLSASNITASGNAENGAVLDTTAVGFTGLRPSLTLAGVNDFSGNAFDGLLFDSFGTVSLSSVSADRNGSDGVEGTTELGITLSCGSLLQNGAYGLNVTTPEVVVLRGVAAFANAGGGDLHIDAPVAYYYPLCP